MVIRPRRGRRLFNAVLAVLAALSIDAPRSPASPPADNGAVFVVYHRFGEPRQLGSNIRLDQFEAHLAELASGRYNVMPVLEILAALAGNHALPERTVGITIDEAFASVYAEAWPRLEAAGLPFTLFASTDALDNRLAGYMTWNQLGEMLAAGGVTLGHRSAARRHMPKQTDATNRTEIARASARFQEKLATQPRIFAYPFGEYSLALRDLIARSGFAAAFGQQSGAVARTTDRYALPRFGLTEAYGEIDRFRLVVNSLPLPVTGVIPIDPLVRPHDNPPPYGFSVARGIDRLASLNCFASGNEITIERLGKRRIETRLARPLAPGRTRINCTMPGPEGRWRWLGMQFYMLP
jgi:peptidoglycan/xylan/chitin deacetylase (PgdA/CDA1 family)